MSRCRGFTLIELITITILIGILAAFAIPRLNIGGFQQYTWDLEVRSALRHAQKVAIGSRCEVEVVINSGGYTVNYTGEGGAVCSSTLNHPQRGGSFTGSPGGDAGVVSGATVVFDGRGSTTQEYEIVFDGGRSLIVENGSGYIRDA